MLLTLNNSPIAAKTELNRGNGNGSKDSEKKPSLLDFGFSLKAAIKEMIAEFKEQEFSQPIIFNMLRERNPTIAEHIHKASVSATLSTLSNEGLIVATFEGHGNDPKRYRLAEEAKSDLFS